ncbi:MAG: adenine deaminase [Bacteroidetes bacterium]|nr:adenine deaminase [Bacteroidota bacterium]
MSGNIVDVVNRRVFRGTIVVEEGRIVSMKEEMVESPDFIIPGFIDAHVHVESSMLIPSEFARLAVVHGTVATVSDPHEIANVLGIPGVNYMIENGKKVPFRFFFGAPSCVPATPFETTGAVFGLEETETLLQMPDIKYLSEMMNFPGVLHADSQVMGKLELARKLGKKADGHAPGLKGKEARTYADAGISTDHECFSYEEAVDKIKAGMKILIREGSAAKNFDELIPLIQDYPEMVMLCSDDKHPNDLIKGHINLLAVRAIAAGYDWMSVLRSCSLIPARHYGLEVGLLQVSDPADFVVVENLTELRVLETYIGGLKVAEGGKCLIPGIPEETPNNFNAGKIFPQDIQVPATTGRIRVQKALDGQLITNVLSCEAKIEEGMVVSDVQKDILKMLVMNRYQPAMPAINFVSGFGLKQGALASTVAHDSHNIIAVGTSDEEICRAVNLLVDARGGVSLVNGEEEMVLPLPVAGLMSEKDGYQVASLYDKLDRKAKSLGSHLSAPYMTLSFMALLVIPNLKLSDKGLFDGVTFQYTNLFI